jgi:hypothetical protein
MVLNKPLDYESWLKDLSYVSGALSPTKIAAGCKLQGDLLSSQYIKVIFLGPCTEVYYHS